MSNDNNTVVNNNNNSNCTVKNSINKTPQTINDINNKSVDVDNNNKNIVINNKNKKTDLKNKNEKQKKKGKPIPYSNIRTPEGLTPNQELFCRKYVELMPRNGTKAYLEVFGCDDESAKSGAATLLALPNVASRIKALESEFIAQHYISRDNVLAGLWDVYNRCIDAVPVTNFKGEVVKYEVTDEDGNVTELACHWKFDSKGAVMALQNIGKYLGLFNADMSSGSHVNITVNAEIASVRELIAERMSQLQASNTIDASPDI